MTWHIVLGIYLIIGAVIGVLLYLYMDSQAKKYEDGEEIHPIDVDLLNIVSLYMRSIGPKPFIATIFVTCTLFWLPLIFIKGTNES